MSIKDRVAKRTALESTETAATVIHAIIRQEYGEDAYEWDPLTVSLEVRADFDAEMNTVTLDRWSAIQIVMTSDAFFKRIDAFLGICNTLSSGAPFFQVFDPVTVEEAAWAITEVALNRELLPFSYPIKKYIKVVLGQDGYDSDAPAIFDEVLKQKPETGSLRQSLRTLSNRSAVEAFVDEQLTDMVSQFNKIPSLKDLDNIILHRSMNEYVGTLINDD